MAVKSKKRAVTRSKGAVTRPKKAPPDTTAIFERLLKRAPKAQRYVLKLFITGSTTRSTQAIENIRNLCDEFLPGRYDLVVVDIYQQPTEARGEQIIAAPTLIRESPRPARRMIGNLSDRGRVLIGLDLHESDKPATAGKTEWLKV